MRTEDRPLWSAINCRRHALGFVAIVTCCVATSLGLAAPVCKVTLRVIDQDGKPVPAADASVTFVKASRSEAARGKTDSNGLFSGEGETVAHIAFSAVKDGYYRTVGGTYFFQHVAGRWQPWNQTIELVLKKILTPVPMYAKRVGLKVPVMGNRVGFDLMVGDWVAPHGRGSVADFVFQADLQERNRRDFDYTLTVTFSNLGDGIQIFDAPPYPKESLLKSPHQAPADGYQTKWIQTRMRRPDGYETTQDPNRNYFFRVRSEAGADGRVTKALYGKIYGDFMYFTYFLNPDGTQNIEFDPKRNLFTNLKEEEGVREP